MTMQVEFLAADDVIDHQHPSVRACAERLGGGGVGAEEYARAAYAFVRDEIAHSADAGWYSKAYVASEVLAAGNAICMGKSHLYAALLRARGIPAGLCYQRLRDGEGGFCLHGLNAVFLGGRWARLDARGGGRGEFSLVRERLAWTVDAALGEVDCTELFATPPELVRGPLAAGSYGDLPSELPVAR
jgi:transglutaminase-like putative cysteine protease